MASASAHRLFLVLGRQAPMTKIVSIEDLLRDPEPITIPTGRRPKKGDADSEEEAVVVFIRLPSVLERQMAMEAANGSRRRLRAVLEDPKTEQHNLLIAEPLLAAGPAELRQLWIGGHLIERVSTIHLESLEEREYIPEPEGDIVTAAEQDGYVAAVEKSEDSRQEQLTAALTAIQRELEEESKKISDKELRKAAVPAHIETLVGQEWAAENAAQVIARCTFSDRKYAKPFFRTTDQVKRLREQRPRIYQRLADAHQGLLLATEPTLGF